MSDFQPFQPRRELGRTGFRATALGIGDLADRSLPLETCVATLRRAIDAGLNLVDTAPGYEDGYSEQIVGAAVAGARDRLFIVDKIDDLDAPVGRQIDASLARLGLASTDAFVFHNLSSMETYRRLAQPGGGFDQLDECIRAGKTRFGGISSHDPDVLGAAIVAGRCAIAMFPIGPFVDPRYVGEILPLARAHGVGTICFKVKRHSGSGPLPTRGSANSRAKPGYATSGNTSKAIKFSRASGKDRSARWASAASAHSRMSTAAGASARKYSSRTMPAW